MVAGAIPRLCKDLEAGLNACFARRQRAQINDGNTADVGMYVYAPNTELVWLGEMSRWRAFQAQKENLENVITSRGGDRRMERQGRNAFRPGKESTFHPNGAPSLSSRPSLLNLCRRAAITHRRCWSPHGLVVMFPLMTLCNPENPASTTMSQCFRKKASPILIIQPTASSLETALLGKTDPSLAPYAAVDRCETAWTLRADHPFA